MNGSAVRVARVVVGVQAALVFAAFALPLSSFPRLRASLPAPGGVSIFIPDVIVVLALLSWPLARVFARANMRRLETPVLGIPLALFALSLVPGIVRGHERYGASLVAQPVRVVLYAGIAAAMVSLMPRDAFRGLVFVFYAGALWQAGLAVFSLATGSHQTGSYVLSTGGTRVTSLSAAMFVSGALLLALMNLGDGRFRHYRWLHLAVIPAAVFAIAASYGRTTLAALVLVLPLVVLQVKGLRQRIRRYWWAPVLVVLAVGASAPWIAPTLIDRVTSNPFHDHTVRWRVAAAKASLAGMRSGNWTTVSALDPNRERLENGGFENRTAGWYVQGGTISTIPSNNPFFGQRSLKLVTDGARVDEGPFSDPVLTAVGQSWTFSIWLKGEVGGELVNVSVWSYGDGEEPTGQTNLPVTLTTTPTQYVVSTIVQDRETTHIRVLVRTRERPQAITAYADGASLKSTRAISGSRGAGQSETLPASGWVQQVLGSDGNPHETSGAPRIEGGRNYLSNPNFEDGTTGWSVQGGRLRTIESNNPAFGARSLEMTTAGTETDEGLYSVAVAAHPGQTWIFSIWLKGQDENERVNVSIWQYDRRGGSVHQTLAPFALSATPTQYFVASTISNPETTQVRALVRTNGGPQAITVDADSAVFGVRAPPKPASSTPTGKAVGAPPVASHESGLRSAEPVIGLGFGRSSEYIWGGNVYHLYGDPHNSYVWLFAGGGALALGAFLFLLAAFGRDAWRRFRASRGIERALVLWGLAMWLIVMINTLAGPILSDPPLLLAVWVLMLLPALVTRSDEASGEKRS